MDPHPKRGHKSRHKKKSETKKGKRTVVINGKVGGVALHHAAACRGGTQTARLVK